MLVQLLLLQVCAYKQVTNGFPVEPKPLFLSSNFPTENRPGLQDQSIEGVMNQLGNILKKSTLEMNDTATWPSQTKSDVAKWLSDWHLVAFLCMQGLFSLVSPPVRPRYTTKFRLTNQEEQKLLCKASTAHSTGDDSTLEHLFASGGWQTLLTIMESSLPCALLDWFWSKANTTANNGNSSNQRSETPSAAFEGMGIGSPHFPSLDAGAGGQGGASGGDSGGGGAATEKECPHCTFVNEAGSTDCEICGLPLSG